jgi:hypothetical protein
VTWDENWNICCGLGLKPIAFETNEEQMCFNNLTKGKCTTFYRVCLLTELATVGWKLNYNYWTAGTDRKSPGVWSWCGTKPTQGLFDGLNWGIGQPDNLRGVENCLHMQLSKNGTGISFNVKNCSMKFILACEVKYFIKQCIKFLFNNS